VWSYGTINLTSRFVKRISGGVQGLNPLVISVKGNVVSGPEIYSFSSKTLHYIIIPRFTPDGEALSASEARALYDDTGAHLGVFKDKKSADKYAPVLERTYKAYAKKSLNEEFKSDKDLIDFTFQYSDNTALSWYRGNIDLFARPIVELANKKIETVSAIAIKIGSEHIVIPRVASIDGQPTLLSSAEATDLYLETGEHLGKYASAREASAAIKIIERQQSSYYAKYYKTTQSELPLKAWKPVELLLKEGVGEPPFAGIITLPDLVGEAQKYFQSNLLDINVSYNMDLNSSVTIRVRDEAYLMMDNNYFVPRRVVQYRGRDYEIADISCQAGSGGSPEVSITICSRAIQQMKRDKKRGSVKGGSGYEYAKNAATKYNLGFIGQKTAKTKSQFNARSGEQEESVWDVLTRTAGNNQFVCFEVDGILIYAQHEYLMWKYGLIEALVREGGKSLIRKYLPLLYVPGNDGPISDYELERIGLGEATNIKYAQHSLNRLGFRLETWPTFETSDNDALAANGSCKVLMPNGGQIRPGHTVLVGPKPDYFFGAYLVTNVSFSEGSPESAQVTFRTPIEPTKQNGKPIKNIAATSPVSLAQRNIRL
jgi:hypothetical protein